MKPIAIAAFWALTACGAATVPVLDIAPRAVPIGGPVIAASGEIMSLLNAQRASQGRAPLQENARLSQASLAHAQDMVAGSYFSHRGRDGSSFSDRARAAGNTCAAAENIASGQRSEIEVMTSWINSPGHRRNILLSDATEYGIGRSGTTWVMMFGRGC